MRFRLPMAGAGCVSFFRSSLREIAALFAVFALSSATPSAAATFYVSPTGLASNDGSLARPLNLDTALSSQGPVRPGDTVWLRGGLYRQAAMPDSHGDPAVFLSTLNGTASAPIVVRQYPGERATLDGGLSPTAPVLVAYGSYTWFWGFEITNAHPDRYASRGDGISSFGHHNRYINLVIHDTGQGVGYWATTQADDSEIYGSIISHVGYEASDRGHGHSIYVQNVNGVKRITDNILFEGFSFGVHAYTANGRIDNISLAGNIVFNHGILSVTGGAKANILFAGDQVAQNPVVSGNFSYFPAGSIGRGVDMSGCNNTRLQDNFMAGGTPLQLSSCNAVVTGNTLYGSVSGALQAAYPSNVFGTTPTGVAVGIRPNAYEAGRANVVIYNWARQATVSAALSAAGLAVGDAYEIRDAQNYFGPALFAGVYNGQAVFPMTGLVAAPVIGNAPIQPGHTSAEFAVFVVQRVSAGTQVRPSASLTASPPAITAGGSTTLTWTTSGAATITIDQGIGAVAASGSRTVAPAAATTYTLTATNSAGATITTAAITVSAPPAPNVAPTVSLTVPNGSSFTTGSTVTITATAGDQDGTVARVDFFVDGQAIGSDPTSPYATTWTATTAGVHSLTAVAVDNANARTTSAAVSVSVTAATGGGSGVNVALAANGATASASSTYSVDYAARAAIDGRRSGTTRGQVGTWEDASEALPDWLQINFATSFTINQVNVYSMQESYNAPIEPTAALTSYLAAEDFDVQYWDGIRWVVVPGGQVIGNRRVWAQVVFSPVTTSAVRIVVNKVAGGRSRLTEVEVLTAGSSTPPPANVPPTVNITAPSGGSTFTKDSSVALTANAGDSDGTVARVDFYVDGQLIASDAASPYAAAWSAGTVGSHSVTAVAVDNMNAARTSAAVSISVAAVPPPPPFNVAPTVSLTAPGGGTAVTAGSVVTITATAADQDGTVARVSFYVDGQAIGSGSTSPYAATWTATSPGAHTLTAVATDNLNASTTSASVSVSVTAVSGTRVNVALAANGATASASSTYSVDYPARAAIDGRRSGATRGQLGTWEDSSEGTPDWLQVSFAAASTISQVNIYSMQEAYNAPIEPTAALTSYLAIEDFEVQYWDGSRWVIVPGGQVFGNKRVWAQANFTPITTSAIRVVVSKVAGGRTRLTEIEALTP